MPLGGGGGGGGDNLTDDVPLLEFTYPVFTHTPCESFCRQLTPSLLCIDEHHVPGSKM